MEQLQAIKERWQPVAAGQVDADGAARADIRYLIAEVEKLARERDALTKLIDTVPFENIRDLCIYVDNTVDDTAYARATFDKVQEVKQWLKQALKNYMERNWKIPEANHETQ